MTEPEWLACRSPFEMLRYLRGRATERKARLLSFACYRCLPGQVYEALAARAIKLAEDAADGLATTADLVSVEVELMHALLYANKPLRGIYAARALALRASNDNSFWAAETAVIRSGYEVDAPSPSLSVKATAKVLQTQIDLIRDIFGDPYRRVLFRPEWRTSTVLALAQQMYDARDYSAMPILADALQDAECDDEAILTHCRGPGPHTNGCWVVDACLGRS